MNPSNEEQKQGLVKRLFAASSTQLLLAAAVSGPINLVKEVADFRVAAELLFAELKRRDDVPAHLVPALDHVSLVFGEMHEVLAKHRETTNRLLEELKRQL